MKTSIEERLIEALERIDGEIPNVNYGGCGFVAIALSKALALCGMRSSIIDIGGGRHYVVKLGETYLEFGGAFAMNSRDFASNARSRYSTSEHRRIGRKYLQELLDVPRLWNPMYSRTWNDELTLLVNGAVARAVGMDET